MLNIINHHKCKLKPQWDDNCIPIIALLKCRKQYHLLGRMQSNWNSQQFGSSLGTHLPQECAIPSLGVYHKNQCSSRDLYRSGQGDLISTSPSWKEPSTCEGINKSLSSRVECVLLHQQRGWISNLKEARQKSTYNLLSFI